MTGSRFCTSLSNHDEPDLEMSKRLNKRQQRLEDEFKHAEEQAAAAAIKKPEVQEEEEEEQELISTRSTTGGGGAFAALNDGLDDAEEEEEEEDEVEVDTPKKKSNKKKKKKKTKTGLPSDLLDSSAPSSPASISTPSRQTPGSKGAKSTPSKDAMGMDELDRALLEIKAKFGDLDQPATSTSTSSQPAESTSSSSYALRTLLSVDLKNLDADAELRKFFGSKVVGNAASSSSSSSGKRGTLLKTHLAKPRGNWPPPNTFLGLGMRELTEGEVKEKRRGMGSKGLKDKEDGSGSAERWWTFEHGGGWREAERQFLGAVGSHDPNQLFALLQVFPYHTDTILQMGEVYRQQADLSQASEYIDRALFAFERAFAPGFNIAQGNVRLDFDRVENRGFYLALIRNLQFLGRRGCWVTSFTFAKLLLAMDPHTDPQASLLWLDFLAIKSNSHTWLLSLLSTWDASLSDLGWKSASKENEKERIVLSALPGMGWAKALALRAEEKSKEKKGEKEESGEGTEKKSDEALREAMMTFPWVLPLLADKVGFSIPPEARNHPLLELRLGYEPGPLTPLHLLSHIYVLRSSALWKELPTLHWLQSRLPHILPLLLSPSNASYPPRQAVLDHFKNGTPEGIVRHVMVAEDNSTLLGFLEPRVREGMGMAFDPLPPRRSVSSYDNNYFMGLTTRRSAAGRNRSNDDDEAAQEQAGFLQGFINSLMEWTRPGAEGGPGGEDEGVLRALAGRVREVFGGEGVSLAEDERFVLPVRRFWS
ncbi:transcriptional repressor TCF25-domain-containing protein [Mrakia frigida]|uniref:Rqc1p n=1 Tax=Mrakia frigida TaxID=29902 RepID=UPI003FCC13CD